MLSPLGLLLSLGALACATLSQLSYQRISPVDLPDTLFEASVYRSSTAAPAAILDDPNDDVLLSPSIDKYRFKKQGLRPPQKYLKEFSCSPEVYRLQHRETGNVLGYLLISPELEWLVRYNKDKGEVRVWIADPYENAGR